MRRVACATVSLSPFLLALPAHAQDADLGDASVVALPEISVTANLAPTSLDKVGSAVTVITGEELREQKIQFVSDALRQVPGLAVNRTGPIGQLTQVRIRGSEGNQTKVFIDGVPVNDPAFGSEFDFSTLLADDVERIEVLRGPQSALYGSDAVGGVINIVTRTGEPGTHISGRLEGGSFGTVNGNASISGAGEMYNFIVSGMGYKTDGISVASENLGNTEKDGYRNGTVFAKGSLSPNEYFDMSGVIRYTSTKTDTDTDTYLPAYGHTGPTDSLQDTTGDDLYSRAQARLSLFDHHWEQIAGVSYTKTDTKYRNLAPTVVTSTYEGSTRRFDYQSNVFFNTPEVFDASHVVTFAVQNEEDGVVSDSAYSSFDRTVNSTGFVGQYQLSLFENLNLTGSIRHDVNEIFEDSTTYRATAAYFIDRTGTKLHGSFGTGVKNPTMFELYGYTNTYSGNPDLKPEEATGWDVGVDQQLFAGRAGVDVTYFNQRISDMITGSGQSSINLPGTSKIDGVEVGLSVNPIDPLTVRASYTYTDGHDATGAELVRRPRNVASLDINYRFLHDRANVNLNIDYTGVQKDWVYNQSYTQTYVVDLDAYTLVNLAASYDVNENAQIYGRVNNILNEDYYDVWGYGEEGISAYAGVKLTF
ncbi:TonB-dependent receptor plug domain-containing protein [Amorphus sp. 3PC139-8]|uniref:TonB-dependent receptor plug domain-containing protein n=1 Tax=Amorphus sp. 3PC139-8 TaxID=2735676 RepID=UPI00345D6AC1